MCLICQEGKTLGLPGALHIPNAGVFGYLPYHKRGIALLHVQVENEGDLLCKRCRSSMYAASYCLQVGLATSYESGKDCISTNLQKTFFGLQHEGPCLATLLQYGGKALE